jgi:hypothetical protein
MKRLSAFILVLLVTPVLAGCGTGGSVKVEWSQDTSYSLFGVSVTETGRAWAVGIDGVIISCRKSGDHETADGGSGWRREESGTRKTLNDVFALDENHVWAVGDGGTVLFYDGKGWLFQDSGTDIQLNSVTGIDNRHVWACGWGGVVIFFDGSTWSKLRTGSSVLTGISSFDESHVWAVGSNGLILFYDGSSWHEEQSGTYAELTDVVAIGPRETWACGLRGTVLEYDGKWHSRRTGEEMFQGISVSPERDIWVGGYTTRGYCDNTGSQILRYSDSWESVSIDQNIFPTGLAVENGVWVSGLGGVVRGHL